MTTKHLTRWIASGLAIYVALALFGCASLSGIDTAQTGLAAVDVGLDQAVDLYKKAADLCARNDDLPACERLGNPEEVLRKAEALSAAYDDTVEGLDKMQAAANEIAPHFEAARDVVRGAGLFSR